MRQDWFSRSEIRCKDDHLSLVSHGELCYRIKHEYIGCITEEFCNTEWDIITFI